MTALLFTTTVSMIIYAFFVERWRATWLKTKNEAHCNPSGKTSISVLVAARNEEKNISNLLQSLLNQTYRGQYEIIVVNDNSTDETAEIIRQTAILHDIIKPASSTGIGKKRAIEDAVALSSYNLLVTTDADCTHNPNWLATIAYAYETQKPQMLIAPVKMKAQDTLWSKIFELEFMALQLSTAATALMQNPIMCNGANLAFEKDTYRQADTQLEYASGDDMFLMIETIKKGGKIIYLKNQNATVVTTAPSRLLTYLRQRSRWLRKSQGYHHRPIQLTALIMLIGNAAWPIALASAIIFEDTISTTAALALLSAKAAIDYRLLASGADFFEIRVKKITFILLELLYPLMVATIGVTTLFRNKRKW